MGLPHVLLAHRGPSRTVQRMTSDATSQPVLQCDMPDELARALRDYTPPASITALWPGLIAPFTDLILRSGRQTRLRVMTDIRVLAQVAAYLHAERRPVNVETVVSNAALAGHDNYQACAGVGSKTRENNRGALRRLHAVHDDLPWREERMPDGARITSMVQPEAAADLARVVLAAQSDTSLQAECLVDAVSRARAVRSGSCAGEKLTASRWRHAQRFAGGLGIDLTHAWLTKAVTHDALLEAAPLAVLASRYGFTRRDLDLALTHNLDSGKPLSGAERSSLRG